MARTHIVKAGDHVPKLAAASGFGRHDPIWNHAQNATLAKTRTPCVLNPGDELFIPDPAPKALSLATGKRHKFVILRPAVHLRLAVLDASRKPVAGASGKLHCDSATFSVTLESDGKFDQPIPIATETCRLVLGKQEFVVLVGHLVPLAELNGWRQRLNNLGYHAGAPAPAPDADQAEKAEDDLELRSAIEEFQCDNGLALTGKRDATTEAKLLKIHGS